MKIIYKKGDLLDSDCMLIAHGCNAQGVMGSGVAKAVRARYPIAYELYHSHFLDKGLALGENISVGINGENKVIVNCITQEFYGRDSSRIYINYKAIKQCMYNINFLYNLDYNCVALPKIGAGLGGGDWDIISKIIEEELVNIQPVVYEL